MSPAYDVLVIDLDGTLLDRSGGVSERNRRALQDASAAGITVIIATGRSYRESRPSLVRVGYDGPLIAAGGAHLCDAASGRTLDRSVLPLDVVEQVTTRLVAHGHKALILKDAHATGYDYLAVGPAGLDPASEWWFEALSVAVLHVDDLAEDAHPNDTLRAGVVAPAATLEGLVAELRHELHDRVMMQHWPAVTASHCIGAETHLLEIFGPTTDKWTMVAAFCAQRGVPADRVAAIGDGLNDVQMVQQAGLGVAMGNAMPEVRQVADRVTRRHDEDGVALAIDQILAGVW